MTAMHDKISSYLQGRIDAADFPSAVFLAGRGEVLLSGAAGNAVIGTEQIAATMETIYDLASLTKPLITGLLSAIYVERGIISPDHRVSAHLGEFDVEGKRMITVGDLLAHTSHLPAWKPLYLLTDDPAEAVSAIARLDLVYGPDGVIYSDLNFIVLGAMLERLTGQTLAGLSDDEIFRPLGLSSTFFNPPRELRKRTAASEEGNRFEKQTCIEQGYIDASYKGHAFRDGVIWGEVHDGNAFFMRGIAGHAGLFSTAGETYRMAVQFLPGRSELLRDDTCELFRQNLTPGMNEDRSFAFQLASTTDSTAGSRIAEESFGHLGFTGTSLWIDPVSMSAYVLLTNRTHGRQLPFANINGVRRRFHELAAEALEENR